MSYSELISIHCASFKELLSTVCVCVCGGVCLRAWQNIVLLNDKHLVAIITRWSLRVQVRYRTCSEGSFEAFRSLCRTRTYLPPLIIALITIK